MAVPFSNTKLRVPRGFQNILEGLAREVLRNQPTDIYAFGAVYFEKLLKNRKGDGADPAQHGARMEDRFYNNQAFKKPDIDPSNTAQQDAALKIQTKYRQHDAKKVVQTKREEQAATKIQAGFRGHQDRERVKEMRKSGSSGHAESQPATDSPAEAQGTDDAVDIDINDPQVAAAATTIQAGFKGYKARKEVEELKHKRDEQTVDAGSQGQGGGSTGSRRQSEKAASTTGSRKASNAADVPADGQEPPGSRKQSNASKKSKSDKSIVEQDMVPEEAKEQEFFGFFSRKKEEPDKKDESGKKDDSGRKEDTGRRQEASRREERVGGGVEGKDSKYLYSQILIGEAAMEAEYGDPRSHERNPVLRAERGTALRAEPNQAPLNAEMPGESEEAAENLLARNSRQQAGAKTIQHQINYPNEAITEDGGDQDEFDAEVAETMIASHKRDGAVSSLQMPPGPAKSATSMEQVITQIRAQSPNLLVDVTVCEPHQPKVTVKVAGEDGETDDEEVDPEMTKAATKIQATFRGHRDRKALQKEHEGKDIEEDVDKIKVTTIQHLESAPVPEPPLPVVVTGELEDDPEMTKAATKIQATFRGHRDRKALHKEHDGKEENTDEIKVATIQQLESAPVPEPPQPVVASGGSKDTCATAGSKDTSTTAGSKDTCTTAGSMDTGTTAETGTTAVSKDTETTATSGTTAGTDSTESSKDSLSAKLNVSKDSLPIARRRMSRSSPRGSNESLSSKSAATTVKFKSGKEDMKDPAASDPIDPQEEKAATKIQATFRGHRTRKQIEKEKEEEEAAEREAANKKKAAVTFQEEQESLRAKRTGSAIRAASPQAQLVTQEIHITVPEASAAATKIQAQYKGHKSRQEFDEIKAESSAGLGGAPPLVKPSNESKVSSKESNKHIHWASKSDSARNFKRKSQPSFSGSNKELHGILSTKTSSPDNTEGHGLRSSESLPTVSGGHKGRKKSPSSSNIRPQAKRTSSTSPVPSITIKRDYESSAEKMHKPSQGKLMPPKVRDSREVLQLASGSRKTSKQRIGSSDSKSLVHKGTSKTSQSSINRPVSPSDSAVDAAATKIQAHFKGHMVRKQKENKEQRAADAHAAELEQIEKEAAKKEEAAASAAAAEDEELERKVAEIQEDITKEQTQDLKAEPNAESSEQAPADEEAPAGEEEAPAEGEEQAPAGEEEAPADGEEQAPADGEEQAPAGDEQAPAGDEQAPAEEEAPAEEQADESPKE